MFLNVFNLLTLLAPWDPVVRLIELIEILDEHDNADKIYMMNQTRDYLLPIKSRRPRPLAKRLLLGPNQMIMSALARTSPHQ